MTIRQGINDWLSIILKVMAIGGIIILVGYFGLSVWGNVVENKVAKIPDDAQYTVLLVDAGQIYLTDDYDVLGNGKYQLNGYFELVKNKWREKDAVITLDEATCGEIVIERRSE